MNIRRPDNQNENIRETEISENQKRIVPRHEKLWVWQKAHKLMLLIYKICNKLPYTEKYRLSYQIQRSSKSVMDNIAEGNTTYYFNDKIKCFHTSRKEAGETQNHIREMESKNFIDPHLSQAMIEEYEEIIRGLNGLINKVQKLKTFFKSKGQEYL